MHFEARVADFHALEELIFGRDRRGNASLVIGQRIRKYQLSQKGQRGSAVGSAVDL